MKTYKTDIPSDSLTRQYLPADYIDAFACDATGAKPLSAEDIMVCFWTVMPGWVNALFRLRNVLVRPFGLKGDESKERTAELENIIRNGGSTGLASVADKSGSETVLKLSDNHLDAYMSVQTSQINNKQTVTAITLVYYHNRLGRVYFFFIRPFHGVIVKSMLKCAIKRLEKLNR